MKWIKNKKFWAGLILAAAIAGGSYYYFEVYSAPSQKVAAEADLQTAVVRRGDLEISTTGAGVLIAGNEEDLNFPVSGTVAELNVRVGDIVTTGQVLAVLDNLDQLEAAVASKKVALLQAQKTVEALYSGADLALGQAKQTLALAQQAYEKAKDNLLAGSMRRCDDDTSDEYYAEYWTAQQELDALSNLREGYGLDYYQELIQPVEQRRDKAYVNWQYCSGYTEAEILGSEANLQVSQAALVQAEANYQALAEASGIDPDELALAEADLTNAELQLELAQSNLEKATMVATMDGTVISIAADEGETVGTTTYITLADQAHPNVEVYVDETDINNIAIGYKTEVVFDALPDKVFTGTVIQVDSKLVSFGGYQTIRGLIELDPAGLANIRALPLGLNATVDIIGGSTQNALLVPVEALRELGEDEYAVFVVQSGEPKLRVVEVGLKDYTYAEILSGINEGDVVTTGIVETK